MEQKPDSLNTKWTRSLQDMPPFTHELLEHHLIEETSKKRQGRQTTKGTQTQDTMAVALKLFQYHVYGGKHGRNCHQGIFTKV